MVLAALPPSLRPLLSAASGFDGAERLAALAFVDLPAATEAPAAEQDPSRPDTLRPQPVRLETSREDSARVAAVAALERAARVLDGEWDLPWRDAVEAEIELRNVLQDSAAGAAQRDLKAFLTEPEAPPPAAPLPGPDRDGFLRRVVAAAHTGVAFRAEIPDFGRARAAALIAATVDDSWRGAWESLIAAQPSRAFWSALTLQSPAWLPHEPIDSFQSLSHLLDFEARLRQVLPPEVPTPMDGPAFRKRLERFAARGPEMLTQEPQALLSAGGAARWVALRADIFALAPPAKRAAILSALDALERAAMLSESGSALRRAVQAVRSGTPGALRAGAAAGPSASDAALGPPAIGYEDAAAAIDFGQRWISAAEEGSDSGAGFWADALERWLDAARRRDPAAAFQQFGRLRDALAPGVHPGAAPEPGDPRAAVIALLEACTARAISSLGDADPIGQFHALAPVWFAAIRDGRTADAPALRDAVVNAAAGAAERQAANQPEDQAAIDPVQFEQQARRALAETLAGEVRAGAIPAALNFAADVLMVFQALGPSARAPAGGFLDEIGALLASDKTPSGREVRHQHPTEAARIADTAVGAAMSWSSAFAAKDFDPENTRPAPCGWPSIRRTALTELIVTRFGPAFADYMARVPQAPAIPAPPDPDAPPEAQRLIADGGDFADLALAANAIESWRAHFEAVLTTRRAGAAAPEPVGLSPHLSPALSEVSELDDAADARALAAIERVFTEAPKLAARVLGEDVAWTLTQLDSLTRSPKERPRDALVFPPAPAPVRAAWADLAEAARAAEAAPGRGGMAPEPFSANGFFLFLATKLLARAEGREAPLIGSVGPMSVLEQHPIRERAGSMQHPAARWMREYIYFERPAEKADAIAALSDEDMAARLDRALLFLNLFRVQMSGIGDSDPSALWEARPLPAPAAERLDPPPRLIARLTAYLQDAPDARAAVAWTFDRARLYYLPEWGALKGVIVG